MFVDYRTTVERSASEVGRDLIASTTELEGLGTAAYRRGEELRSRIGPGSPFAKEVVVALGPPHMSRTGLVIPVTWRATGAGALFPRLEGELSVAAIDDSTSSLRLLASYQPPFGWIGDLVDRLLLARFARTTVVDWVDRVGEAVAVDRQQV